MNAKAHLHPCEVQLLKIIETERPSSKFCTYFSAEFEAILNGTDKATRDRVAAHPDGASAQAIASQARYRTLAHLDRLAVEAAKKSTEYQGLQRNEVKAFCWIMGMAAFVAFMLWMLLR